MSQDSSNTFFTHLSNSHHSVLFLNPNNIALSLDVMLEKDSIDRFHWEHRAKKVMSDSLGLVDIAIGLVTFVLNYAQQVKFFVENSN